MKISFHYFPRSDVDSLPEQHLRTLSTSWQTSALLLVNCWKLDTVQLMAASKMGRFLLAEGHLGPTLSGSWQTLPKETLRSHFNLVLVGEGVPGNFSYPSRPGGFLNPVRKRIQGKDLCYFVSAVTNHLKFRDLKQCKCIISQSAWIWLVSLLWVSQAKNQGWGLIRRLWESTLNSFRSRDRPRLDKPAKAWGAELLVGPTAEARLPQARGVRWPLGKDTWPYLIFVCKISKN